MQTFTWGVLFPVGMVLGVGSKTLVEKRNTDDPQDGQESMACTYSDGRLRTGSRRILSRTRSQRTTILVLDTWDNG